MSPNESVSVIVTLNVPLTVGVPEMTPAALMLMPAGKFVAVKLLEPEPPLTVTVVAGYGTPLVDSGSDNGPEITSGGGGAPTPTVWLPPNVTVPAIIDLTDVSTVPRSCTSIVGA